jgi:hypothetical protein
VVEVWTDGPLDNESMDWWTSGWWRYALMDHWTMKVWTGGPDLPDEPVMSFALRSLPFNITTVILPIVG